MSRINDDYGIRNQYDSPFSSDALEKKKGLFSEKKVNPDDMYDIDLEVSHEQKVPGDIQFATQATTCGTCGTCATCWVGGCRGI